MKLWLAGQSKTADGSVWEFQGIFDTEARAVTACRDESYFVAPVDLNGEVEHETGNFPGAYYPKAPQLQS